MDALDDDDDDDTLHSAKPGPDEAHIATSFPAAVVPSTPRTQDERVETFATPTFATPLPVTQSRSQPSRRQAYSQGATSQSRSKSQPPSQVSHAASAISTAKPKLPGAFGLLPPLVRHFEFAIPFHHVV